MGHSNKKYKKIKILIMTLNIYESLSFTERPFSSGFSWHLWSQAMATSSVFYRGSWDRQSVMEEFLAAADRLVMILFRAGLRLS